MSQYLIQFKYATRAVRNLVQNPEIDHARQAAAMVSSVGAKLLGYWYAFGRFDGMVLLEAADISTVASISMAIGGTGEVTDLETVVLLTMEEARQAMYKAATATHLPEKEAER